MKYTRCGKCSKKIYEGQTAYDYGYCTFCTKECAKESISSIIYEFIIDERDCEGEE